MRSAKAKGLRRKKRSSNKTVTATGCGKQGAGLLRTEAEEGGVVGAGKLQADAAIDHG